jgi:hypothetical protein
MALEDGLQANKASPASTARPSSHLIPIFFKVSTDFGVPLGGAALYEFRRYRYIDEQATPI